MENIFNKLKGFSKLFSVFLAFTAFSQNSYAQGVMVSPALWQKNAPMCSPITFGPDFHINGQIHAIKVVGNTAYIGGDFTEVQGQPRERLAAVDITTGLVSGFNPRLNGAVRSLEYDMGLLFVGGEFTSTQDYQSSRGGGIVSNVGVFNSSSPSLHGWVEVSIPDGAGGWYIAGQIWSVGGEGRDMVARINSDGSVHAFNAGYIDGRINDIHLDSVNGILYIAGLFTEVNGQPRNYIAALDTSTGNVTAWNPNADDEVIAIELMGGILYAAGRFGNIGGQSRAYIAALDTTVNTNNATAWDPDSNGYIHTMAAGGTTVYVAGWFDRVGGEYRPAIAALDTTINTNNATAWEPQVGTLTSGYGDQTINSMLLDGTTLYVGGSFADIGGQLRNSLAALDTTLNINMATAWNPDIQFNSSLGFVRTMALDGTTLYIGGKFDRVGNQNRSHVAALDTTVNTNNATAWAPQVSIYDPMDPYDSIRGLSVSGTNIYIGAGLYSVGGLFRQGLAAIDTTMDTNNVTAWNPKVNHWVNKMIMFGTTLYIGGNFSMVENTSRPGAAALDTTLNIGMLKSWDADMTIDATYGEGVKDMVLDGTTLYLGGDFTHINGQVRNRIGAVSISTDTNNVTAWNPNATSGSVRALALSGTTIYVGGSFTNIGGQSRNHIAALDTTVNTNNATSWNPGADGSINTLATRGTTVYAGGEFTNIGGLNRNRLAGLSMSVNTNNAIDWDPNADDTVYTLKIHNDTLLAGGSFWGMNNNWDRQQLSTMCVPP